MVVLLWGLQRRDTVCFRLGCFFFSSRRRHTRCLSDWSSDVCSSDLTRLFRTRRAVRLGGLVCACPAPEDQLVLQGVEKVVARRAFHLSDVVHTIATIRRGDLDWDYIIATARALGVRAGLSCYLQLVHDIHARLLGGELLARDTRRELGPRLSRRARFDRAGFHGPALWVPGRVPARPM